MNDFPRCIKRNVPDCHGDVALVHPLKEAPVPPHTLPNKTNQGSLACPMCPDG